LRKSAYRCAVMYWSSLLTHVDRSIVPHVCSGARQTRTIVMVRAYARHIGDMSLVKK
jgi:hypothetical protein